MVGSLTVLDASAKNRWPGRVEIALKGDFVYISNAGWLVGECCKPQRISRGEDAGNIRGRAPVRAKEDPTGARPFVTVHLPIEIRRVRQHIP
jgi:hypothetical protein